MQNVKSYILGPCLENWTTNNTFVLHQQGYIKKFLEHFGIVDCNPKATSLDIELNSSLLGCPDEADAELQYKLCVLYLWQRPDLGNEVSFRG